MVLEMIAITEYLAWRMLLNMTKQIIDSGCWSLDEKMGQTYIHYEQANTLAAIDYKQPQVVIYGVNRHDSRSSDTEDY